MTARVTSHSDDSSAWRSTIWVAVLAVAFLSAGYLQEAELVRLRFVLLFTVTALGYEAFRILPALTPSRRTLLMAYFVATLSIVIGSAAAAASPPFETGKALLPVLGAWALGLAVERHRGFAGSGPQIGQSTTIVLAVLGVCLIWWLITQATIQRFPTIIDEVLYLMQAKSVFDPPYGRSLAPGLEPFFTLRQSFVRDGLLIAQYPPGWPAILAGLTAFLSPTLVTFVVYASTLAATYLLARRLVSAQAGVIGVLLLGLNPFFLSLSSTFFPHTISATLLLLAALALLTGFRATTVTRRWLWSATAGALVGLACATRPLTGVALGVGIWLFMVWFEFPGRRVAVQATAAVLLGSVVPFGWFLHYNAVTTGHPLQLGYQLANQGLHGIGFGTRGWVMYAPDGVPSAVTIDFTPILALRSAVENLGIVLEHFWPGLLLFPLLFLFSSGSRRVRWKLVIPFMLLPLAYAFFFYRSERFSIELLPFAMIATGWIIERIGRERPRVAIGAIALLVITSGASTIDTSIERKDGADRLRRFVHAIDDARRDRGPLLVFVNEGVSSPNETLLEALYSYNVEEFPGDVIVARDLGERNADLRRQFPTHVPLRVTRQPCTDGRAGWCPLIQELDPGP